MRNIETVEIRDGLQNELHHSAGGGSTNSVSLSVRPGDEVLEGAAVKVLGGYVESVGSFVHLKLVLRYLLVLDYARVVQTPERFSFNRSVFHT